MLDILEVAYEKGKSEGLKEVRNLGAKKGEALGMAKGYRYTLKELIVDKYDNIPERVLHKIDELDKINILKILFKKALKFDSIEKFEKILNLY